NSNGPHLARLSAAGESLLRSKAGAASACLPEPCRSASTSRFHSARRGSLKVLASRNAHESPLFNVLHQLAHPFESALDFHHVAGDFHVAGFGANRIRLSKHFLSEELQLAAGTFRLVHDVPKLLQVTA